MAGLFNRLSSLLYSTAATANPALQMAAKETVENAIQSNKIVIFSKSWCPHCKSAKGLILSEFASIKNEIKVSELDEMGDEGVKIQEYLLEKTGQRTVPNIFINNKHIGGNDALQKLNSEGKLQSLISVA